MTIRYSQTNTPEAKIPRNNFRQLAMKRILAIFWRIAPAPTRRFLEDRLFSPRTDPIPTSQTLILESGQRFQVQIKDKIVQCWKLGHGPSILFVHGWNGRGIQFHHFFDRIFETFTTKATVKEMRIEICSKCHPFYSGEQKLIDTAGRVDRFLKKYGQSGATPAPKKKK